ncbi:MAG: hypothetical protein NW220_14995 [Leptolyngbyaceae cyanobacterium bins.349]|nr:hypothetical protein [Leptolyngbyaceae cyanobacterium bins.349]
MKRFLLHLVICGMVLWGLAIARPAQAHLIADGAIVAEVSTARETVQDLLTQLEKDVLPKLETILSPEQREQFTALIGEGSSFRKAFKSLTLTPDQKMKLKDLLSNMPKKGAFASLTPEQKKQLFMKKKEMFKPTPAEISERMNQGMKSKGGFMPEGIGEQIQTKLESLKQFIPD